MDPGGEAQFKGIGGSIQFTSTERPPLFQAPTIELVGVGGLTGGEAIALVRLILCPTHIDRLHRLALNQELLSALLAGPFEADAVGGKDHAIEPLAYGIHRSSENEHISACGVHADFKQGLHPSGGIKPAGRKGITFLSLLNVGTRLTLKKRATATPFESQHREAFIPKEPAHAWSSRDFAATSSRRYRLCNSRPAACIAAAPPSSRSTIVTTRFTL